MSSTPSQPPLTGSTARSRQPSEPGYRRPMVLVQADSFNRSRIQTVVAVAVTTNTNLASAPGNVLLPRRDTGLPQESVANVSQILTINKTALIERAGILFSLLLRRIEAGLRLVLDLWGNETKSESPSASVRRFAGLVLPPSYCLRPAWSNFRRRGGESRPLMACRGTSQR